MTKIEIDNNPDGSLTGSNYWFGSDLEESGLVYLSLYGDTLRLLLPPIAAAEWMHDIKTAQRVLIEPSVRAGKTGFIDVVFDDGSAQPFSCSIDPYYQFDAEQLPQTVRRCLVYTEGAQLAAAFPCEVRLFLNIEHQLATQQQAEYINHVTVNTGHNRQSPRSEFRATSLETVRPILGRLREGGPFVIDDYTLVLEEEHPGWVLFTISRLDSQRPTPIIHFSCCKDEGQREPAWSAVNGSGEAPPVPYCAAHLLNDNLRAGDADSAALFADMERTLTWTWLATPRTETPKQGA